MVDKDFELLGDLHIKQSLKKDRCTDMCYVTKAEYPAVSDDILKEVYAQEFMVRADAVRSFGIAFFLQNFR